MLGFARTMSETSWFTRLSTLSICLTVLMRFGITFTFQLLLSTRNITPSWGHKGNMHQIYG